MKKLLLTGLVVAIGLAPAFALAHATLVPPRPGRCRRKCRGGGVSQTLLRL